MVYVSPQPGGRQKNQRSGGFWNRTEPNSASASKTEGSGSSPLAPEEKKSGNENRKEMKNNTE